MSSIFYVIKIQSNLLVTAIDAYKRDNKSPESALQTVKALLPKVNLLQASDALVHANKHGYPEVTALIAKSILRNHEHTGQCHCEGSALILAAQQGDEDKVKCLIKWGVVFKPTRLQWK